MAHLKREWTLCPDQGEWLSEMAEKHGLADGNAALQQLIDYCNAGTLGCGTSVSEWPVAKRLRYAENNERKKTIFRTIRCNRCSQASMGGKKVSFDLQTRTEQFAWYDKESDFLHRGNIPIVILSQDENFSMG